MKKTYYSNGKLLITGEYLVLDGAKAFALPTQKGQNMIVEDCEKQIITWKSHDFDGSIWYEDTLTFDAITEGNKSDKTESIRNTLIAILHEAWLLNPDYLKFSEGYAITTHLTFPKFWGLGTSSTLINNIAQWLQINAYELLQNSFGGSGYDIACAKNNSPIVYQLVNEKPIVEQVDFHPNFAEHLYFVYLNRKQSSKAAIASYYRKQHQLFKTISIVDKITSAVLEAKNLRDFAYELEKHEAILSDVLEMQTVKETFFSDFKGVIKSLGGWGGDFILAVSKENPTDYFQKRGFHTIIPYQEMILK